MSNLIGFRAKPHERQKLEALARGEGVTVSDVLRKLVERAPVTRQTVEVLRLRNDKAGAILADTHAGNVTT